MKFTLFSKTLRTASLTALLTAIVSVNVQQPAQAIFGALDESWMACSTAYFGDPDQMYGNPESIDESERVELDQATWDAIDAAVTTFAVELDAPIGYIANKVNGVAVEIPPEIEQAMQEEMADASREKVRMLNEKYGQYATFGQQITLVYSSEQVRQIQELFRDFYARTKVLWTPEELQEQQELGSSFGPCNVIGGFADMGIAASRVIQVGERPDFDARLREDTTGATFFR
jgi:hypothetical protein